MKNKIKEKDKDPCWKNYKMVGTKNKNGKEVPNCVPKNESRVVTFYEWMKAKDLKIQ